MWSLMPSFMEIGWGVSELQDPPPQTPFPILNVHRPYHSVSTTVLHCDCSIASYATGPCSQYRLPPLYKVYIHSTVKHALQSDCQSVWLVLRRQRTWWQSPCLRPTNSFIHFIYCPFLARVFIIVMCSRRLVSSWWPPRYAVAAAIHITKFNNDTVGLDKIAFRYFMQPCR